ncbi:CHAT domain-containing protein [Sphingomonas sanguinis]|uniref:CHAT domain-containing protein n=1 Tax=Sphingomonas sanguinis TaxID=33051 RepID=UPI001C59A060|nr:CHAT domain-containing protein [Sphingomonas sanguinis]QXT34860.1 CHAT domain-containing protein [Sphingomonas sanguinis]
MHWTSLTELAARIAASLEVRHPGMVSRVHAALRGDVVVLAGEVASEDCRSDAKRLALSFDGVFKVRNEIIVAGYLAPASDDDLDSYFRSPAPEPPRRKRGYPVGGGLQRRSDRSGVERRIVKAGRRPDGDVDLVDVLRCPSIGSTGNLVPAGRVEISVDLKTGSTGAASIAVGRFPADWTTIAVAVQLIAPWAEAVETVSGAVILNADGTSTPAVFSCRIAPDFDGSSAQVQAVFMHGTRICGFLAKDLLPTGNADGRSGEADRASTVDIGDGPGDASSISAALTPSVRVVPDAAGPSLTVTITSADRDAQTWFWQAAMPGGLSVGIGRIDLKDDAKRFSDTLLGSCPDLAPNRVGRVMDGIGEHLWRVAPAEFREGYAKWRAALGTDFPIQFITEDPYVPWEMMKPEIADAGHLFVDHPVARWPAQRTGLLRERLGRGEILSFVPSYAPGQGLPHAELEGRWMAQALGAVTMTARTDAFFDVLDGRHPNGVAMIHFAGHGRVDTGQRDGGIQLEDGFVGVMDVDQTRTVVGLECATLVLLNACETSAGARMLGTNTGWGAAIAARGFGGLLAPLWEVDDGMALEMIKAVLPALLQRRETLGESLRTARRVHCASSASAFAYLAHGDVMATFPS